MSWSFQERTDYYGVLGCVRSSTPDQVTAEFRRRSLLVHPDRNAGGDAALTAAFQDLSEAYRVLSDPAERRRYDTYLASGLLVSYAQWRAKVVDGHASVHWDARPADDARRIEGADPQPKAATPGRTIRVEVDRGTDRSGAKGDTRDELIRKFREYEI